MDKNIIFKINEQNKTEQIDSIINLLFSRSKDINKQSDLSKVEMSGYLKSMRTVKSIFDSITLPYSVVIERFYISKEYRDSYYSFFSNKHFQTDRYCTRVSMFKEEIDSLNWFLEEEKQDKLKKSIIGFFVISPLDIKHISKALIDPKYLMNRKAYIRLSKYICHIYGITFEFNAFPYQMQDTETTRCAEVTVLNILDYYANTYKEYRSIVPSDIIRLERKHCHERVLPSRGINYRILTKILYDLGFSPRLYNRQTMHNNSLSGISQDDEMKRLLYYYVESGMITAVNLEPKDYRSNGHSILCIGHGAERNIKNAEDKSKVIYSNNNESASSKKELKILNSADFYDEFIVMDDNQMPYRLRKYSNLSLYDHLKVSNIVVPLYKRMFLEASDAYDIAMNIIEDEKLGVFKRAQSYLESSSAESIVMRLFLASSRTYKNFKVEDKEQSKEFKMFYSSILLLPQFIWVCELYTKEGYLENKAFGEIIIDATSVAKSGIQSLISISYPSGINFRWPYNTIEELNENWYSNPEWKEFNGYNKNLAFDKS